MDRGQKKEEAVARVHWAPVFVTNDEIHTAIRQFTEVRSIKHELYTDEGLEGVATGGRLRSFY